MDATGQGLTGGLFPRCPQRPGGGHQGSSEKPAYLEGEPVAATNRLVVGVGQFDGHRVQNSRANSVATAAQIPASHQIKINGVKVAMWAPSLRTTMVWGPLARFSSFWVTEYREATGVCREHRS